MHLTPHTPNFENRRSTGTDEIKTPELYKITQQYQYEEDKISNKEYPRTKNWNYYKDELTSIKLDIHLSWMKNMCALQHMRRNA